MADQILKSNVIVIRDVIHGAIIVSSSRVISIPATLLPGSW